MGNVVLEAMACGCPVVAPAPAAFRAWWSMARPACSIAPGNLDDAVRATPGHRGRRLRTTWAARDEVAGGTGPTRSIGFGTSTRIRLANTRVGCTRDISPALGPTVTFGLVAAFKSISSPPKKSENPAGASAAPRLAHACRKSVRPDRLLRRWTLWSAGKFAAR